MWTCCADVDYRTAATKSVGALQRTWRQIEFDVNCGGFSTLALHAEVAESPPGVQVHLYAPPEAISRPKGRLKTIFPLQAIMHGTRDSTE